MVFAHGEFNLVMTLEWINEFDREFGFLKKNNKGENDAWIILILGKHELTLRTTIDEVKNGIDKYRLLAKIDVTFDIYSNEYDIWGMTVLISNKTWRLEISDLDNITLIKSWKIVQELQEKDISLLFNGIEIKPKKICNEEDEKSFIDEVRNRWEATVIKNRFR